MRQLGILWRAWVLLLLAAGWGVAVSTAEPQAAYSVSAVKAAYLVNFVRFTTWPALPAQADDPIVIGVAGDREVEDYVFKLSAGQQIQGHPVRVRRVVRDDELAQCHVVYFGSFAEDELKRMLGALGASPVLTVSTQPTFLAGGGMVGFYSEGSNLRFEISLPAVNRGGLVLSSRLLALSRPRSPKPTSAP
ncbi:YfiR family protein [Nibricoccus sp. IMCC34717]|uniref:YfiR family protein n=1 Tax=Nibricoccus sp. IMCC34717 TaxID=3034021 RepID=UPI00384C7E40